MSWQKKFFVIFLLVFSFEMEVRATEMEDMQFLLEESTEEVLNLLEVEESTSLEEEISEEVVEIEEEDVNKKEEVIEDNDSQIDINLGELKEEDTSIEENTDIEENIIEKLWDKEEIFTIYSDKMEFSNDKVVVQGNIQKNLTVIEILSNIDIDILINEYDLVSIVITNEEDNQMLEDDVISYGSHIVFVGKNYITRYKIEILGDFNNDIVVNEEDIEVAIDKVLENKDKVVVEDVITVEDISYVSAVVKENTYQVNEPIEEILVGNLVVEDNDYYVGDKINILYEVGGFNYNYINTISGLLEYDHDMLSLDVIYVLVDGYVVGKVKDDMFIYVLEDYKSKKFSLKFVFDSLNSGNTYVNLDEVKLVMNGKLLLSENNTNLSFLIKEYGKGGDVPIVSLPDSNLVQSPNLEKKPSTLVKEESNNSFVFDNSYNHGATMIVLSDDKSIKKLEVLGYDVLLDASTNRYLVEVDEEVKSLDLNVLLNNENASYNVYGNKDFKVGKNEVILTVIAEDGSSKDYILEVNKVESKVSLTKKDGLALKLENKSYKRVVLFVILIILIITVLRIIYQLIKKVD